MKIRSVTCFVGVDETVSSELISQSGNLASASKEILPSLGYDVQTTRLAVQPLDQIVAPNRAVEFASLLEENLRRQAFDYGAVALQGAEYGKQVPGIVRATQNIFASLRIASRAGGIDLGALRAAAHTIYDLARTTQDGFGNFRFAGAANVPPSVPFFPAAYYDGVAPGFAFATEAADLAVQAFTSAGTLEQARANLVEALEFHGEQILSAGEKLEDKFGLRFLGIDFSLAPFPEESRSIGAALERLSGSPFGMRGTLFASAFLTDCLRRANFRRTGFCGLMLPMTEDWGMASRSQEGLYSLDSLLLFSTVCGTGLDNIPLEGNTSEAAISLLLMDLAALAVKLDKPLTARLIPVPGLGVGEMTHFTFEYFANAKTLELRAPSEVRTFRTEERVEFLTDE